MRSWVLALAYFALCWAAAAISGVLELLRDDPFGPGQDARDPWFWLATLTVAGFIARAYWVVWPRGTTTESRAPDRLSSFVFGMLNGVSEGLLYLSAWHLVVDAWGRSVGTFLALLVLVAGFNATWRTLVWDVWVTPIHNIAEWNTRKIARVHAPALFLALGHLMIYEAAVHFVLFETIALTGSAVFMRFPSPRAGR
jgi:hypothetical protein